MSGLHTSGLHTSGVHSMGRYLVVANWTLTGEHLLAALRERIERSGDSRIHVLVPATPDPTSRHNHAQEDDLLQAHERLVEALQRFEDLGAAVSGEVGDALVLEAIDDVLRSEPPFDEILLSTMPPGPSRWLRMDLPSRVARRFDVPVTHLVAEPVEADRPPSSG